MLAADLSLWTNPDNPYDVNDDGIVSPIDSLIIANDLTENGIRPLSITGAAKPAPYLDPTNNDLVSPLDFDAVVRYLDQNSTTLKSSSLTSGGSSALGMPGFNTPPMAMADDFFVIHDDFTLSVTAPGLLGNDMDMEFDPLTAELVSGPSNASSFTFNANGDGGFSYTPQANWAGADTFSYRAFDGTDYSSPAQVTIYVINSAPTLTGILTDVNRWVENNAPVEIDLWSLFDDMDDTDQQLTYSVVANSNSSIVETSINPNTGTLTLDLAGVAGISDLTIQASDRPGEFVNVGFQIGMFEVTGMSVERETDPGTWVTVPPTEWMWTHDNLRWTATINPSAPPLSNMQVEWRHTTWDDYLDKLSQGIVSPETWPSFTSGGCIGNSCTGLGHPVGANVWAIMPELQIGGLTMEKAYLANKVPVQAKIAEILSVEWDGVELSDGATNLSFDNPLDMGAGWKFLYGKNTPTGPVHKTVEIVVKVAPNEAGIPIRLDNIDADDPTDHDGPIDIDPSPNNKDNRTGIGWTTSQKTTVTTDGANSEVRKALGLSESPGDNLRTVASAGNRTSTSLIKPKSSLTTPEVLGRLFIDDNDDDIHGAGEPILEDGSRAAYKDNLFVPSSLLTTWRMLHVEIDSMGAPDPNTNYGFNADDPDTGGPIDTPDIGAFIPAFWPAFIDIGSVPAAWNQSNLPFRREFVSDADADNYFFTQGRRQSQIEDDDYWTVYVVGSYELGPAFAGADNDPNSESARLGQTRIPKEPEFSLIPQEIIRDVAAQHGWNAQQIDDFKRIVALHEVGHQFELDHLGGVFLQDVMTVHNSDAQESQISGIAPVFTDKDIHIIRNTAKVAPNHP